LGINAVYLLVAICAEVVATTALTASHGFTRLGPSLVTVVFYCLAFYLLSLPLRTMPVGVVYAIWCGLGIMLMAGIGTFWFKQPIDLAAVLGLALIVGGILVVTLFSKTVRH
jgi:small multidrug resistance pump